MYVTPFAWKGLAFFARLLIKTHDFFLAMFHAAILAFFPKISVISFLTTSTSSIWVLLV
jgi:hypothetical protein